MKRLITFLATTLFLLMLVPKTAEAADFYVKKVGTGQMGCTFGLVMVPLMMRSLSANGMAVEPILPALIKTETVIFGTRLAQTRSVRGLR